MERVDPIDTRRERIRVHVRSQDTDGKKKPPPDIDLSQERILKSVSVTCMLSEPPAPCCAAPASSSDVGTYGGLNTRMSAACSRQLDNGYARDAMGGSMVCVFDFLIFLRDVKREKGGGGCCTLFWDVVRAVRLAACGLMSVQKKTCGPGGVCDFFFIARMRERERASTDVRWKRRRSDLGKLRRCQSPII